MKIYCIGTAQGMYADFGTWTESAYLSKEKAELKKTELELIELEKKEGIKYCLYSMDVIE